jgi:uncharacterized membrane protein YhaH (DUF805 family)
MTQATFGRRGTVAAAPPPRLTPARPAARPPSPAPKAAPEAEADNSLLGYFLWLLFSFERRLDRRTYRYVRIPANLGFFGAMYGLRGALLSSTQQPGREMGIALMVLVLLCLMTWTTLAMQVKRWHDRDKSWLWVLVGYIPIVGPIWVLVECCWLEGTPGYNRFDDPARSVASAFA